LTPLAYAMAPTGQGAQGGGFGAFIPLILMFVIFYFLLIRPQQKKQKEHTLMIKNLRKGDRVMTNGGIMGTIASLDETTIHLEVANKVKVKINRGYVAALISPQAGNVPSGQKQENQESREKEKE
jgi:preprotein translocase subunit YajC